MMKNMNKDFLLFLFNFQPSAFNKLGANPSFCTWHMHKDKHDDQRNAIGNSL